MHVCMRAFLQPCIHAFMVLWFDGSMFYASAYLYVRVSTKASMHLICSSMRIDDHARAWIHVRMGTRMHKRIW